jgi:hypothetical protein
MPGPQTENEWKIHSLNIHGLFFEPWCQSVVDGSQVWRVADANYPVASSFSTSASLSKESSLDLRLEMAKSEDRRPTLLVECKKNNPEFVDWIFFPRSEQQVRPFISLNRIETQVVSSRSGRSSH